MIFPLRIPTAVTAMTAVMACDGGREHHPWRPLKSRNAFHLPFTKGPEQNSAAFFRLESGIVRDP